MPDVSATSDLIEQTAKAIGSPFYWDKRPGIEWWQGLTQNERDNRKEAARLLLATIRPAIETQARDRILAEIDREFAQEISAAESTDYPDEILVGLRAAMNAVARMRRALRDA